MSTSERISEFLSRDSAASMRWIAWLANDSIDPLTYCKKWKPPVMVINDVSNLSELKVQGENLILVEVKNVFWEMYLDASLDINELKHQPMKLSTAISNLNLKVLANIRRALDLGADGIFYRLGGAAPERCTPMEYGGHFMGLDETNLQDVDKDYLNVLYVDGGTGVYLDFVHELPASVLAWDEKGSGISALEFSKVHSGPIASTEQPNDGFEHGIFLVKVESIESGLPADSKAVAKRG